MDFCEGCSSCLEPCGKEAGCVKVLDNLVSFSDFKRKKAMEIREAQYKTKAPLIRPLSKDEKIRKALEKHGSHNKPKP